MTSHHSSQNFDSLENASHSDESLRASSVSQQPIGQLPLGSQTVVNPERRKNPNLQESELSGASQTGESQQGVSHSGVWSRLFPSENEVAMGEGNHFAEGLELGQFVIQKRIGVGGMGAVFAAHDSLLDRIVALKVLSPGQSRNVASVKRFQYEAKAAARLDQENIAKVYSTGEAFGLYYIAFEFVEGLNVRSLLDQRGKLSPVESVSYILQVATALKHTAAAGVVHRDIKPSNIIVKPNGRAKLVDWGLARDVTDVPASKDLTVAGTTLGTFDYISPEQAKDPRRVDERSDIYSLGCTFYQMLTGEPPYGEGTVLQKLLNHQGKQVPNPLEKNPAVSPQMSAVVMKMMDAEPDKRYQTVDALLQDLMSLAAMLGLRGIPVDSVVWEKPQIRTQSNSFLWQNAGLLGTVAVLILSVFVMDLASRGFGTANSDEGGAGNSGYIVGKEDTPRSEPGDLTNIPYSFNDVSSIGTPSTFPSGGDSTIENNRPFTSLLNSTKGLSFNEFDNSRNPFRPGLTKLPDTFVPFITESFPKVDITGTPEGSIPVIDKGMPSEKPTQPEGTPGKTKPIVDNVPAGSGESSPPSVTDVEVSQTLYSIILPDGKPGKKYETLEGAVADAPDGSVVELKFNGDLQTPRVERPFDVVRKSITIRAAKGYSPVIKFERKVFDAPGMIRVTKGSLTIKNVQFIADVQRQGIAGHWSFLNVVDPKEVHLRGVAMTFRNSAKASASVIEVLADPNDDFAEMQKMETPMPEKTPLIELDSCFVRGELGLVSYSHTESIRISIRQSAIAIDGVGLVNLGDDSFRDSVGEIEMELDHSTVFVNRGLIQIDRGDLPRDAASLSVTARNCIFGMNETSKNAFVTFKGEIPEVGFKELFRWKGQQNIFDGVNIFLTGTAKQGLATAAPKLGFKEWKESWSSPSENQSEIDSPLWKEQNRSASLLQWNRKQFQLNPGIKNPALELEAGVNLDLLPHFDFLNAAKKRVTKDGVTQHDKASVPLGLKKDETTPPSTPSSTNLIPMTSPVVIPPPLD